MNIRTCRLKRGFTLTETVIAIGVVALMLTSFLAVFGPARDQIQSAVGRDEADRLVASLESELSSLRPNETYASSFDKAFDWVINSGNTSDAIFLYTYRADPRGAVRADESMAPVLDHRAISGQDAITTPAVRRFSDALFLEDADAIQSQLCYVRLTQLVFNDASGYTLGQEGTITDPQGGGATITSGNDYPDAVLALRADFFVLPSKSLSWINNGFDASRFTTPDFSRNIAIRR